MRYGQLYSFYYEINNSLSRHNLTLFANNLNFLNKNSLKITRSSRLIIAFEYENERDMTMFTVWDLKWKIIKIYRTRLK